MASPLPLQFLRPMSLPRAATLHKFLGQSLSRSSLSQLRKSSTSNSSSTLTSPSSALPTSSMPSTSTSPATPIKPYLILRTPSNKLPIYHLSKRGGNKKLTRVRKIEGDVNMLRMDLQKELGVGEKDVVVNQLTRQVIVKGHMKSQIEKFFLNLQQ